MGLLLGIIGVNVIAHTIGDKIVESNRVKSEAEIKAAAIRERAIVKAEKIRSRSEIKQAKINAQNRVDTTKLVTAASVMNTAMATGVYPGNNNIQQRGNYNNGLFQGGYGNNNTQQRGLFGNNQGSFFQKRNVPAYRQIESNMEIIDDINEGTRGDHEIMFCGSCGKNRIAGTAFCVYCGGKF